LATTEGNLEFKDVAQLVGRIAGVSGVAEKPLPRWMLGLAGRAMEIIANITGKTPQITYKTSMYSMQKIWVDLSKAVKLSKLIRRFD